MGNRRRMRLFTLIVPTIAVFLAWTAVAWGAPVLTEDFEGGAALWTKNGFWHVQADPQTVSVVSGINPQLVTLPDAGSLPAPTSGTHAAWFGELATGTFCGSDFAAANQTPKNGCMSSTPFSGELTSPAFSLVGAASAQVSFNGWYEIEGVNSNSFDLMSVEYSTDGVSWTTTGLLNPINNPAAAHDQPYANTGLATAPAWRPYVVDLTPAIGNPSVQVRFSFNTVDSLFQGFRGWLVDDVVVSTPFTAGGPVITSAAPDCVPGPADTVVALTGTGFVTGSTAVVDGVDVPTAVLSSTRIELSAGPGQHTIAVRTPGGVTSGTLTLCAPAPPPPPPPPPPPRPKANLSVTTNCPKVVVPGKDYVCTAKVTNHGPDPSPNVQLKETTPVKEVLLRAVPSQGSCTRSRDLRCALGLLPNGGSATVKITAIARRPGALFGDLVAAGGGALASMATKAVPIAKLPSMTSRIVVDDASAIDEVPADDGETDVVRVRDRPNGIRIARVGASTHRGRKNLNAVINKPAYGFFSDDGVHFYAADLIGCSTTGGDTGYGYAFARGRSAFVKSPAGQRRAFNISFRLQVRASTWTGGTTWSTIQGPGAYVSPKTGSAGNDFLGNNPFWQYVSVWTTAGNPWFDSPQYRFSFHQAGEVYRLQVRWTFFRERTGPNRVHEYGWDSVDWCRSGGD